MKNKLLRKKIKQIIQEIIEQAGSSGPRPSLDKGRRAGASQTIGTRPFKPKRKPIRSKGGGVSKIGGNGGVKFTPHKGDGITGGNSMTGTGSSSWVPGPDDMCVNPIGQQIQCEDCNVISYGGGDAITGPDYYLCGTSLSQDFDDPGEWGTPGPNDICYNMIGQQIMCTDMCYCLGDGTCTMCQD